MCAECPAVKQFLYHDLSCLMVRKQINFDLVVRKSKSLGTMYVDDENYKRTKKEKKKTNRRS